MSHVMVGDPPDKPYFLVFFAFEGSMAVGLKPPTKRESHRSSAETKQTCGVSNNRRRDIQGTRAPAEDLPRDATRAQAFGCEHRPVGPVVDSCHIPSVYKIKRPGKCG